MPILCASKFQACWNSQKCQSWSSLVAQQVKDLALSLLWHGFHPRPRYFHMPQLWPKKKEGKRKKRNVNMCFYSGTRLPKSTSQILLWESCDIFPLCLLDSFLSYNNSTFGIFAIGIDLLVLL